jgi:hypothetical protein
MEVHEQEVNNMAFFIAERDRETEKFLLWQADGEVKKIYNEAEALDLYEMALKLQGNQNVLLLEEVVVDVELSVKRWKPDNGGD